MRFKAREKECVICKETYITSSNNSKYCSKVCSPHTKVPWHKKPKVECPTCNKPFIRKVEHHKFCSRKCSPHKPGSEAFQGNKMSSPVERECTICKETFSTVFVTQKTCSKNCRRIIWRSENPELNKKYEKKQTLKRSKCPRRKSWKARNHVLRSFGLTEEMFIKLYEEQGGLCLGCDIKFVSNMLLEERKQYDDDPNLIVNVDYALACVDHDHSYDIDGKHSGNPDSVRGLLCPACNCRDVLNPESDNYIYGVDGDLNKIQLVMDLDFKKQLKKKAG